jgi:hypothetical protein
MLVSSQGKVVLFIQIIQILAVIVALVLSPTTLPTKLVGILSAIFLMGIGTWLTFTSVNCMVFGDCNVFAWLIVGVLVVTFAFAFLGSIIGIAAVKKAQDKLHGVVSSTQQQLQTQAGAPSFVSLFQKPPTQQAVPAQTTATVPTTTPTTVPTTTTPTTPPTTTPTTTVAAK